MWWVKSHVKVTGHQLNHVGEPEKSSSVSEPEKRSSAKFTNLGHQEKYFV